MVFVGVGSVSGFIYFYSGGQLLASITLQRIALALCTISMSELYKDYSFQEWVELSFDEQRDIVNNYWNPFKPEIGAETKNNLLNAFKDSINDDLIYYQIRYFGFYTDAIFVIPKNPNTRLPSSFHGLTINKGKIIEKINNEQYRVNWKHSAEELLRIIHNSDNAKNCA